MACHFMKPQSVQYGTAYPPNGEIVAELGLAASYNLSVAIRQQESNEREVRLRQ